PHAACGRAEAHVLLHTLTVLPTSAALADRTAMLAIAQNARGAGKPVQEVLMGAVMVSAAAGCRRRRSSRGEEVLGAVRIPAGHRLSSARRAGGTAAGYWVPPGGCCLFFRR